MKLSNLLSLVVVVALIPSIIEAAELSNKVCKPTNTCVGCWGDCVRVGNRLKCCTWYRPSADQDTQEGENLVTEDQDAIDANVVPSIIEAAGSSTITICERRTSCSGCSGSCTVTATTGGNSYKCCYSRPSVEHDTQKGESLVTEDQDAIDANVVPSIIEAAGRSTIIVCERRSTCSGCSGTCAPLSPTDYKCCTPRLSAEQDAQEGKNLHVDSSSCGGTVKSRVPCADCTKAGGTCNYYLGHLIYCCLPPKAKMQ
jgi:hypothetical protein